MASIQFFWGYRSWKRSTSRDRCKGIEKPQPDHAVLCHQVPPMEAEEQEEDASSLSKDESEINSRYSLRYVLLGIIFLLLAGAAAATWYFLGKNATCFVPMQEV